MVAGPMRGPSRCDGLPGVRMRGARALYLRMFFFEWSHGAGTRKAQCSRVSWSRPVPEEFAALMRLGPAGPGIPRDEVRPRTKKRQRKRCGVKVRECSQVYRPPNPPDKFKTNLSVWLARLKPPRAIWRLCSPHCSPEVNPGDAIARAVLGSVCLLE